MQVFQKKSAYLGGMDEALAILKLCSHDWDDLTVHALYDGDRIEPWETALTIEGDYTFFAHLETLYLGVLARRTLITTNVVRVLEAARGKPIIFMPARHEGARGTRPRRIRAREDRRVRRLHGREDRGVRTEGRAGRLVRRRLVADSRRERLHRRRRAHRRPAVRQSRSTLPCERTPRAR